MTDRARAGASAPSLEQAERLLRERFGLTAFRAGQREVIAHLLTEGRALAVFPTGAGKSLCFQLPALMLEGVTVVVSPLIALMKDQIDYLVGRGIPAARLDSSLTAEEARSVAARMRDGSLKLLYASPERFNNERFLAQLRETPIALFAVDEAHCVSQWGHGFRPIYLLLSERIRELGVPRVVALTATATPEVARDICAGFGIPETAAVVTGFYRPNLRLLTTPVARARRDEALRAALEEHPRGTTIVYCTHQQESERVAARLAEAGFPARAYHAGMRDEERVSVQEWWTAGDDRIAVATIAFGMGIDKADVRLVVHYDLPKSLESYGQEIGRAGRDGRPSVVRLLGTGEDAASLQNFAYGDTPTEAALASLVDELLDAGPQVTIDLNRLAATHDVRSLVLSTALVYLELLGVLRQTTPVYTTYRVRPSRSLDEILGGFDAARARFLGDVFAAAKKGREWYTVDPIAAAAAAGEPLAGGRERVIRALDYLAEKELAEVQASDVRHRFVRVGDESPDRVGLVGELLRRFEEREVRDVERVQQVLDLITHPGCQTNQLVGHFGEERLEPCGHCTYCETGRPAVLPPSQDPAPALSSAQVDALGALVQAHPAALREPRQQARFLCGLSSPAASAAKLTRHPLYGALSRSRFEDVLAWCRSAALVA